MKQLNVLICVTVCTFAAPLFVPHGGLTGISRAEAQSEVPDPEQWYREDYAVLWANAPWENQEALMSHSADEVVLHGPDYGIVTESPRWLVEPLAGWRDEGWLGSELVGLEVDRLNATLATFKARWKDRYEEAAVDYGCSWYQADYLEGAWKLTGYADIDCAAHGMGP